MKIWRCSYDGDPEFGSVQSWHRSKREAMAARANLFDDVDCVAVEVINIPTSKAGLIDWLNHYFTTDNG